uniref:Uncharacterized protein n=1 Tax=uncultured marine virus TaxID=186617 RepID=A0A0F7L2I3_9VIRU|nr:hypothetical protein [uncultured marine virus]
MTYQCQQYLLLQIALCLSFLEYVVFVLSLIIIPFLLPLFLLIPLILALSNPIHLFLIKKSNILLSFLATIF